MFLAFRAQADDWSAYQHDTGHTGLSTAQVDAANLSLAWKAPTGYSTPLIVGHTVYATKNGQALGPTTVSSFELATGAINWSYSGNFTFPSQAAVGAGMVIFVGTPSSSPPPGITSLYVLDAATGLLRYTVTLPEGYLSVMPTIFQDPITAATTAFVTDGSLVSAVSLGPGQRIGAFDAKWFVWRTIDADSGW